MYIIQETMKGTPYVKIFLGKPMGLSRLYCMALLVLCQIVISVCSSASPYMLGRVVDSVDAGSTFLWAVAIFGFIAVTSALFTIARERQHEIMKIHIQESIRCEIMHGFFDGSPSNAKHGEYYTTIVDQVDELSYDAVQIVLKTVEIVISLALTIYLFFSASKIVAFVAIIAFPLLSFGTIKAMSVPTKTHEKRQEYDRKYMGTVSEMISVLKELRILPMRQLVNKRYQDMASTKFDADLKHKRAVSFCRSIEKIATIVGVLLVLCFSCVEYKKGVMSIGQIMSVIGYTSIIMGELAQLNYIYDMWVSNKSLYLNMDGLISMQTPRTEDGKVINPIEQIDITNLSFSYDDKNPVIKDLSASLHLNTITAIVGRSGAGKSTLLNLITKRVLPEAGDILIDGESIQDIPANALRDKMAYLTQTPFIFDGSIYDNIEWAVPNLNLGRAREILNQVGLSQMDLDKQIAEGGSTLSGGERQRLALARCIAKDSTVFILDEPFAQLDKSNEDMIIDFIMNNKEKMFIVSTHKLGICSNADQVIHLGRGQEQ